MTYHALSNGPPSSPALDRMSELVGPCWSRMVEDCFDASDEELRKAGRLEACREFSEAADQVPVELYGPWVNELPYCEGYFDYTTPGSQPLHMEQRAGTRKTAILVGGGVAVLAAGVVIGKMML